MADYDLRDLSAPVEALRDEVKAAYGRIDAQWDAVTKELRGLPIPCTVSVVLSEDPSCPLNNECLEFRKWKGSKRVCLTTNSFHNGGYGPEESEEVVPYEEWSSEQRMKMLKRVPELFEAAAKQTQRFIEDAKQLS